ncbi:MAG: sulfite exporter TauE/SafE family protein [Hyphomicrobiaceae bacterium]|nr:sulfite exporter TauE/SafE family protein [Hyphomicrobiaceae bacterium]
MQIYLPIAELPVSVLLILGMGAAVGFISGMFGVGGGFLLTPLLIFSGIPPSVAVATVTPQIVASSTSGVLNYFRRKAVDVKLAGVLLVAGSVGSASGVWVFGLLRAAGQLDLVISVSYMLFLGLIGGLMLLESLRALAKTRAGVSASMREPGQHNFIHKLPFKMRFKRSRLYISVIPVILIGASIGFLGSVLGIGGGFILVPALIYLLRVPTNIVIGTSLLQILVTMAVATLLHAVTNQSVDIILGLILMVGGVIGAQFGASFGQKMRGEQLRLLLALLILAVALRFGVNLVLQPAELYSVAPLAM